MLLGAEGVRKLRDAHVAVIGVGGVGGFAAEALARAGVGHLLALDSDEVSVTNRNRQILALSSNVGRPKCDVLRDRLLDINPDLDLVTIPEYITEENIASLLDGYDIDVIVNEDRTFTIREHITAYFDPTASKHGIIRKIPLSGTLKRNNGTTDDYRARVTEENVSGAPYTTSRSDGYFNIKIGSASHTVSGQQEYVITYTYNMGKDPLKNVDELYLDLIGTD